MHLLFSAQWCKMKGCVWEYVSRWRLALSLTDAWVSSNEANIDNSSSKQRQRKYGLSNSKLGPDYWTTMISTRAPKAHGDTDLEPPDRIGLMSFHTYSQNYWTKSCLTMEKLVPPWSNHEAMRWPMWCTFEANNRVTHLSCTYEFTFSRVRTKWWFQIFFVTVC